MSYPLCPICPEDNQPGLITCCRCDDGTKTCSNGHMWQNCKYCRKVIQREDEVHGVTAVCWRCKIFSYFLEYFW
jgi:hypothetical protein